MPYSMRVAGPLFLVLFSPCLLAASERSSESPPIETVYRQALLVADLAQGEPERWREKVRWKAALPQLRVTFQRDLNDQLRFTNKDNISLSGGDVTIGPDEQDLVRDFDAGMRFQVMAVWYLDDLLFHRDTLLVSQERRRRSEERQLLLERVTKAYFKRREALERLAEEPVSGKQRRELGLVVEMTTAQLDALTDGWFSRIGERRPS